jgi:hypothetical protein
VFQAKKIGYEAKSNTIRWSSILVRHHRLTARSLVLLRDIEELDKQMNNCQSAVFLIFRIIMLGGS